MTMLGFYISWRSNSSEVCEGETCLTLQSGREGVSEGRETSQLFTHTTTNQIAPTKHRKHRGNHQQYKGSPRYHLVFQCDTADVNMESNSRPCSVFWNSVIFFCIDSKWKASGSIFLLQCYFSTRLGINDRSTCYHEICICSISLVLFCIGKDTETMKTYNWNCTNT